MERDDSPPDDGTGRSLGELSQLVHADVPFTRMYVFHGPAHTLVIERNQTTPEERILGEDSDENA